MVHPVAAATAAAAVAAAVAVAAAAATSRSSLGARRSCRYRGLEVAMSLFSTS